MGGAMARMLVSLTMANDAAAVPPKVTAVAPRKPVPVIVTTVPPPVPPVDGFKELTVGAETALYVKWSALPVEDVAAKVVTVMSTVPAVPGGAVATMAASDSTLNASAAAVPNCTPFAPVKPLPLTVTPGPPAALPEVGVVPGTTGAAAFVES